MSAEGVTPVTPEGIRDGDPVALRGLCRRRAGSVLDYARTVCAPDRAIEATAEAFARFRAAVAAADDPRSLHPETLLLGCTRHSAAALVLPAGDLEDCPAMPMLFVGRFDGMLTPAEVQQLGHHLIHCPACRTLDAAFHQAEHVYREPHPSPPPADVEARVIAALVSAAPVVGDAVAGADEVAAPIDDVAPEVVEPEPVAFDPEPEAFAPEPEPEAFAPEPEVVEPEPVAFEPEPGADEPEPEPETVDPEPDPVTAVVPAPADVDVGADEDVAPWDEEHDALEAERAATTAGPAWEAEPDEAWEADVAWPEDEEEDATAVAPVAAAVAVEEAGPRPAGTSRGPMLGLVPRIVVPTAIVLVATTGAMAYAGVFGGVEGEPARGTAGLPAPEPPKRAPIASEEEQEAAAEAFRESLARIEARDRARAAREARERREEREQEREEAEAEDAPGTSATTPPATPAEPERERERSTPRTTPREDRTPEPTAPDDGAAPEPEPTPPPAPAPPAVPDEGGFVPGTPTP